MRIMADFNGTVNSQRVSSAVAIVVESGVAYSVCLIVLIVLYMKQTASEHIVQYAVPQIIVSEPPQGKLSDHLHF